MSDHDDVRGSADSAGPSGRDRVDGGPPGSCPRHPEFDRACLGCRAYDDERAEWLRDRGAATTAAPTGADPASALRDWLAREAPPQHCTAHDEYFNDCGECDQAWENRASFLRAVADAKRQEQPSRSGDLLHGLRDGQWLDAQEFPPLSWSVEGIVPEGFGLIVAPPKAGKSWLVAAIGLTCATGGMALGRIPVKQRPVLYLALEDGHRRLQSRFRTLMEGQPIPKGISVVIKAEQGQVVAMIAEYMVRHQDAAPLVILDTLGKARPPKLRGEDSYAQDYALGTKLKNVADSVTGASLLVVHHTRKAESADFIDAVSGTQGIAGSADFVLVLNRKRKSDQAVLSVTGRDVPENEYALVTDEGRWSLDGKDLMDAAATVATRQQEQQRDRLGDRSASVLAFVASRPMGTRATDLAQQLGISADDAGKYLRRLHDGGLIDKRTRGIYMPATSEQTDTAAVIRTLNDSHVSETETDPDQLKLPSNGHADTSDTSGYANQVEVAATPPIQPVVRSVRVSESVDTPSSECESQTDTSESPVSVCPNVTAVARARVKVLQILADGSELTERFMGRRRMSKESAVGLPAALEQLLGSGEIVSRTVGDKGHRKVLYRLAGTPIPQEGTAS
ncbi:AAA family ATPase [Nocardia sp. NPDC049707]|uniref:AAA family ATPase n=1 Tax=Nocardia sp. NPDC049707 TaxID=3154735 RepID=UPI00341977FC